VNRKIELARHALRAAMQLRRNLAIPREAALNALDVAKSVGVDVRFLDAPSLEGMFVREPGLRILLPSLKHRPRARILYSCAHELGHQQFGHGTRADRYLDERADGPGDEDEFLVDSFAGHLLMPRAAILDAFFRRNCAPKTATPQQLYIISAELGVGYETLLTHLCFALNLLTRDERDRLGKTTPKQIKADFCGSTDERTLMIADKQWKWVPIDAERGDLIGLPTGLGNKVALIHHEFDRADLSFFRAEGVGETALSINGQQVALRIGRRHYVGPYTNRYLADPDEC
jgi:hypothetical protein